MTVTCGAGRGGAEGGGVHQAQAQACARRQVPPCSQLPRGWVVPAPLASAPFSLAHPAVVANSGVGDLHAAQTLGQGVARHRGRGEVQLEGACGQQRRGTGGAVGAVRLRTEPRQ